MQSGPRNTNRCLMSHNNLLIHFKQVILQCLTQARKHMEAQAISHPTNLGK